MNKPVQVTIGEPFDKFVDGEVESGRFHSREAVVEEALRLMEEDQAKYAKLREALIEGERSGEPRYIDRDEFAARMRKKYGQ